MNGEEAKYQNMNTHKERRKFLNFVKNILR